MISAIAYVFGDGAIIAALFVEVMLVACILCLSDDLFPILFPTLCVIVLGTTLIGRMQILTPWLPFAFVLLPAAVCHVILYGKNKAFRPGISLYGILATAAAILLSGIGNTEHSDYTDPTSLYYLIAMSVGLVALYFLFMLEVKREKSYDQMHHFLRDLCFLGLLCSVIILVNLVRWITTTEGNLIVQEYFDLMPYRNTIANLLTLCLPAPFYFAGYVVTRHSAHIFLFLAGCTIYGAMLLTVARTAMLFGTVVLIFCLFYYLKGKEYWYFKVASVLIVTLGLAIFGFSLAKPVYELFSSRLENGLASLSEARWVLLLRSFTDFMEHPLFGIGFISTQNADVYAADACISWYHLYFPQIWGSLGLVGCAAFAYQLFLRFKLAIYRPNDQTVAIALCYLGIFLYSQTDPGEFIPIPFAALAVLMFVFLEHHYEKMKLQEEQGKKTGERGAEASDSTGSDEKADETTHDTTHDTESVNASE